MVGTLTGASYRAGSAVRWCALLMVPAACFIAGCDAFAEPVDSIVDNHPVGAGGTGPLIVFPAGAGGTTVVPPPPPPPPKVTTVSPCPQRKAAALPPTPALPMPTPAAPPPPSAGTRHIRHLNNREYNNTVRDLLGTRSRPADAFLANDYSAFDTFEEPLQMTDMKYEKYFLAAGQLADELLADPVQLARVVTCSPEASGPACVNQIVEAFGARAWRRPLTPEEVVTYVNVYQVAISLGLSPEQAIGEVVRALLSSAQFLYLLEIDQNPADPTPHTVSQYELASRLSYFVWSSMPDDALLQDAAAGQLLSAAVMLNHLDRMIADPRATELVTGFASQWLGIERMATHVASEDVFPEFTPEVAEALGMEASLYFSEFLATDRPWWDFLTADFHYVTARTADLYGIPFPEGVPADSFQRVEAPMGQRFGFLGLAGFLSTTSFQHRTSPTQRAIWIYERLLCTELPDPPPVAEAFQFTGEETEAMLVDGNVREALQDATLAEPVCSACHAVIDPLGLALERFDAIGRFRDAYGDGSAIDTAVVLPDGTTLDGLANLAQYLQGEPRSVNCAASKMFSYAHGREPTPVDEPYIDIAVAQWQASCSMSVRELAEQIVTSDAFFKRHGGTE